MSKHLLYCKDLLNRTLTRSLLFVLAQLVAYLILLIQVISPAEAAGPLTVKPTYPRYFFDSKGQSVYLTGSYLNEYNMLGSSWDFPSYLDFLQQQKQNFTRVWGWEQSPWIYDKTGQITFSTQPYERTGPGLALDGAPRFDLTRFNQAYFDQLRSRVLEAARRGIYVSVMLFEGFSTQKKVSRVNPWLGDPFQQVNNINGINGDPNRNGAGEEFFSLALPSLLALQETFVRKVVDTLNDLDNVLYEVSGNGLAGSLPWQYHMIDYIKRYQAKKANQQPVGISDFDAGAIAEVFNSSADWIVIQETSLNPPLAASNKILIMEGTPSVSGGQVLSASPISLLQVLPDGVVSTQSSGISNKDLSSNGVTPLSSSATSSTLSTTQSLFDQQSKVATPTITPNGGVYSGTVAVTLQTTTRGASIYYTTDGQSPTQSSRLYTGKFTLSASTLVKAKAFNKNFEPSSEASAWFANAGSSTSQTVATPAISPSSGSYTGSVSVTMQTTTSGASIYYTKDGSTPTQSSTLYTGAMTLTSSTVVKAKAFKSGSNPSAETSASFTVTQPATPKITVDSTFPGYTTSPIDDGVINASGGTSSTWASEETATDHWINVTFPSPRQINSAIVHWAFNDYRQAYMTAQSVDIQYWNGSSYQTIASLVYPGSDVSSSSASFATVTTSQLRFLMPAGQGNPRYPAVFWITELDYGIDLVAPASLPIITVDSTLPGYTTSPIDDGVINASGGTSSTWASEETATDHWINVTFPSPRQINSAIVHWAFNDYRQAYMTAQSVDIQYWNGSSYQTIASLVYPGSDVSSSSASFATVTTSQLRFLMPAGQGNPRYPAVFWITELDYGVNIVAPPVAAPTITPKGGSFTGSVSVTMQTTSSGASIYYTTNGSTPTQSSALYTGAMTLTSSAVIKAKAFKSESNPSAETSASFSITQPFSFSLTNSGDKSLVAGSSVTNSIVVTLVSSGTQAVSLSVSGLPSGATGSFSSASCSPSCSSTLTINTTASTPAGSSTITVTASGGGVTKTTTFSLNVGLQTVATPTINPTGGNFTGPVSVTMQTATAGASIYYTTNGSTPTQSSTLYSGPVTLTNSATVKAKAFKSGYNASPEASASFTVTQPFNFSLANSGDKSVNAGSSVTSSIIATLASGNSQTVSFTVSGLPSGATGSFSSSSCSPTCSTVLTISTSVSTPAGDFPITATSTGGGATKTTAFTLRVLSTVATPPITVDSTFPGYTTSAIDDGVINAAGGTSSTWASEETATDHWINVTFPSPRQINSAIIYWAFNNYRQAYMTAQSVNIQYWNGSSYQTIASLVYPGSNVSSSSASFATITTPQLRFLMPAGQGNPSYPQVFWITELDYGLDLVAPTVAAPTIAPNGGSFTNSASLTMQTATSGASIYYTTNGSSPTQSSTLYTGAMTLTSSAVVKAKAFKNGYSASAEASASFTISQPFSFSLANAGDKSLVAGSSVTNSVSTTLTSGSSQAVTFSASGLPTGATASFSSTSCSPACSSTLTINTSGSTPAGNSTITVTASGGGLTKTTTFSLNVSLLEVKATTRYVHPGCPNGASTYNPSGAGSCTGGSSLVYSTINNGLNAMSAGDILDIRAGTYNEQIDLLNRFISSSYPTGTFIQGHVGETVTLLPTSFSGTGMVVFIRGNTYITFKNLIFDGRHSTERVLFAENFARFDGVHLQNCGMVNLSPCAGALIGPDVEFLNGSSHDNGTTSAPYNFTGAQAPYGFYWAGARGVLRNSKIYNNGGYGIHGYSASGGVDDVIIEQNEIYNNGGNYWQTASGERKDSTAILMFTGNRATIRNNLLRGSAASGTQDGITIGAGFGSVVSFNTVRGFTRAGILSANQHNTDIRNNIVVDNVVNINNEGTDNNTSTFTSNLCSTSGGTTNCTGALTEASSTTFINNASDFHLKSGSKAINAAIGSCPPTDFAGTARQAPCDIGAYE
jgi:Chitobiase/beta-hexosaminidase C-terminal domain/Family of unknown function (DUF6298)/Right handed beta helix region